MVLKNNLIPIFCCGEPLDVREKNGHEALVKKQVEESLFHLEAAQVQKVVIAYEPIWAIGTGKSSTSADANEVCGHIRQVIAKQFSQEVANEVRVQYGGSVKPENIKEYMAQSDIDGALVGGASLEPQSFLQLLEGGKNE